MKHLAGNLDQHRPANTVDRTHKLKGGNTMTERLMIKRIHQLVALKRFIEARKIADAFERLYGRDWVLENIGRI